MSDPDWFGLRTDVLDWLASELDEDLLYHGVHHTRDDVLPAASRLARLSGLSGESRLLLLTSALFHDAGFVAQYRENEPIAVAMMKEMVPKYSYSREQSDRVAEIILATRMPQRPAGLLQQLMCDADLDSLGRGDYSVTNRNLYLELQAVGESISSDEWQHQQLAFLNSHKYHTCAARLYGAAGKSANIARLAAQLEAEG